MVVIKLIWNFCKVILIESNIVTVEENSNLYPLFLLGFAWYIIYALSNYFVYYNILKNKKKSLSFFYFLISEFWKIFFNLLFAFFFSFIIIIISSFIISKVQNFFTFLSNDYIHIFIEDILSIAFNVFFAHMIAFLFIYNNTKKKKQIKSR